MGLRTGIIVINFMTWQQNATTHPPTGFKYLAKKMKGTTKRVLLLKIELI